MKLIVFYSLILLTTGLKCKEGQKLVQIIKESRKDLLQGDLNPYNEQCVNPFYLNQTCFKSCGIYNCINRKCVKSLNCYVQQDCNSNFYCYFFNEYNVGKCIKKVPFGKSCKTDLHCTTNYCGRYFKKCGNLSKFEQWLFNLLS